MSKLFIACEALPFPILCLDAALKVCYINAAALDRLGVASQDTWLGRQLSGIAGGVVRTDPFLQSLSSLPVGGGDFVLESAPLSQDDHFKTLSWLARRVSKDEESEPAFVLVGFDGDTLQKERLSSTLFQSIAEGYSGSVVITNPDKTILFVNPVVVEMTGYSQKELVGKTPAIFKSGQTPEEVYQNMWDTLGQGGIWKGEFINQRKDGTLFVEGKTISAIRDSLGRVQFYFGIGEDLAKRTQYQQQIESLTSIDPLTGLPNREAFMRVLVGKLDAAEVGATGVSVLHLDIDNFFEINELAGPGGADRVIAETAVRIRSVLRQDDVLARPGNDKFGVLVGRHDLIDPGDIDDVADRLMATIRQPLWHSDNEILVTASVGVASSPDDGEDAKALLGRAINATELAKNKGGDCYCRFDSSAATQKGSRRALLKELRLAIERNELLLHYQPQVSLFSGKIIGFEALVRWQHPLRGMVMPGEFVLHAEHGSLIVDLGEWVIRESCRQLREWLDAGLFPGKIAVNLGARHFILPGLSSFIADTLACYRLDAHCLEIEITEGVMMQDVQSAILNTTKLKQVGVRLSLDDFGTGYSSLAYMSRFPIDVVKIDQSFVRDITSNPVNAAIAQATIAMSHKLGKIVLAEGGGERGADALFATQ